MTTEEFWDRYYQFNRERCGCSKYGTAEPHCLGCANRLLREWEENND